MTYLPLLLSLRRPSPTELLPLIQPLYLLTIRLYTAYTRATMGQGVRKRRLRVLSSRIDRKIYIYIYTYIPTSFLLLSLATALPAPIPPTRRNNFHGWRASEHCFCCDVSNSMLQFAIVCYSLIWLFFFLEFCVFGFDSFCEKIVTVFITFIFIY